MQLYDSLKRLFSSIFYYKVSIVLQLESLWTPTTQISFTEMLLCLAQSSCTVFCTAISFSGELRAAINISELIIN